MACAVDQLLIRVWLVWWPGECKSKSEEDAIMVREVETLKAKLRESGIERSKMKELLLRLLYVEMLGHDASFGYIHLPSLLNASHRTLSALSVTRLLVTAAARPKTAGACGGGFYKEGAWAQF